ncbi:putative all-trans-retinol 13,14-reductase [Mizuhopecten yessoensis]|uniref:All-trans-retinol 13,14-reductase n=1 Tax=Mizuhopecten yessoensis TaxID=6573 RepID=A0A210PYM8_MIZYE|nr:putative all-trans-retinol 13,14-reductase [Mizuhopecten yessoensis]OWF41588.1 all-trans-retinol 13,14-reductase [Mizuhopecten yessoensis]
MSVDIGMYEFLEYFISRPWLILVVFLLYVIMYALSVMLTGPKSGKNPFSASHIKPVGDLVTDKQVRDRVIKQRFKLSKVPEQIDDIVIGSGIGGLGAAAILSRSGHCVLVLEQHDQAGGCCHTFHEKGYEFDTGIHYIGKMYEGADNRVLIDMVTGGKVEYPRMSDIYDVVCLGDPSKVKKYNIKDERKAFAEELIKEFPNEKEAIEKFMVMLKESRSYLMGYFVLKFLPKWLASFLSATGIMGLVFRPWSKYTYRSTKDVLDSLTDNDDLKAVLTYSFGDYGVAPSKSPFGLQATLLNHYMGGAYYIRGGPSEIALHAIPVIEKTGGRVLVNALVNKIILNQKGRAIGVEVKTGDGSAQIFAKRIISDAGVSNTFKKLLPTEVAQKSKIYPTIKSVGNSLSYMSVFIGMDGSQEELGIKGQNMWCFNRSDQEKAMYEWLDLSVEDAAVSEVPLMFVSFPSAKDPTWAKRFPNKSTCLIITVGRYEWFARWDADKVKHRSDEYEGLKNRMGRQMWNQLTLICPKLEGRDDYFEVGSPLSNKYYLGFDEGEMYGLDHTINKFLPAAAIQLRPKTDIPGLYLTGQDILVCGFSGALYGGMLCASSILNRNLYNDLTKVVKEVKAAIKEGKKTA